ncbi:hypothetical protein [Modestobacter sp. Leaf380]|uniref:hypothetical protein n=1 Tax=Modestobacter sp. Leaf380 TaxID=1736356 RepID=UPI0006F4A763|nr:hypothetical protein [Modestobacter sp. Leaf380]KQS69280.1 hypothetical protein ASG41_21970 [Modestobacter sp. Leaf380]
MTTVLARPTRTSLNRPLMALAAVMVGTALVTGLLAVVAPVEITGTNGWLKPLKFSISIAVYAVTIAWLVDKLPEHRQRLGRAAAWVVVVGLVLEMVVIVGAVAAGTTSHFNVSSPLAGGLWALMGFSIAAVWLVTLALAALLWRSADADAARLLAIRAGLVIGLAGMAVAFLMTSPTPDQLDDFAGIAGAHAVGVPDGGAGLPLLGWSTTGGDLRVPHFVGMHALQALPLLVLALEALSRRVPALRDAALRLRVVAVAAVGYAVLVVLLTLQALAGIPVTDLLG